MSLLIWRRRLFLVSTSTRRFGFWHQRFYAGDAFIAIDLGRYRLGWWYKTTRK